MLRKILPVLSHAFNIIALLFSISYATWFIFDGKLTPPKDIKVDNYYNYQSQAFLKGQVSLLDKPDPRIAALSDPRDAIKTKIPFLWDTSYYKGKYYIYWGPVPAIFYMAWTTVTNNPAPNQIGVLFPYIGIGIILLILLYMLRRQYYPHAPAFTIGIFLLVATLNPPYMLMLARPLTYETSILTGQFFLLLSFFLLFLFITRRRNWILILSGMCMGLAALSRYNLVISLAVFLIFALLHFWLSRTDQAVRFWSRRQFWINAALILVPLAACFVFTLWYNYIRFDNPFETGFRYQITSPVPYERYYSSHYIACNIYLYLFISNPVTKQFPFVKIQQFHSENLPTWAAAFPGKQFDMDFLGLFQSNPIVWFGAISTLILAFIIIRRIQSGKPAVPTERRLAAEMMVVLMAAGLLQMVFLLFYYYSAVRFLGDFVLLMLMAAIFVWWEIDRYLIGRTWLRAGYWGILIFFSLQTMLFGILGGFSIYPYYFSKINPVLYQNIADMTTEFRKVIYAFLNPLAVYNKVVTLITSY